MKFRVFLLSLLLFSVKIAACKCNGELSLQSSFKNADLVFIGEVYDVTEVPSGFKTVQNVLSKISISKIYKSNNDVGYYQQNATLFGSPLHSCDVLFTQKGKYLIFAYDEKDTGFLYSDQCFIQKRLDQLSSKELKELESLSTQYKKLSENSGSSTYTNLIVEYFNPSDRKINEQKLEIATLHQLNNKYRTIIYISVFVVIMLLIALTSIIKQKKQHSNR